MAKFTHVDVLMGAASLLKRGDGWYEVRLEVHLASNGDRYLEQYTLDEINGMVGGWPEFLFRSIQENESE